MWKYTSYVRKGLSHEILGTDCQDSVVICEKPACIVAALADGLGSLDNSAVAADAATQAVAEYFLSGEQTKEALSAPEGIAELAENLISSVQSQIREKAAKLELSTDTMDCTLGFFCVYKQKGYAIIGCLGDSAVCVIKKEGSIVINDPSVSANGTSAVLDEDAAQSLRIHICDLDAEEIQGFLLSSDGLDNEVYMKGMRHVPKTAELYFNSVLRDDPQRVIRERVEELVAYGDSPFDDDISIAVISRAADALCFPEDPTWLCTCGTRNRIQDSYCCHCDNDMVAVYENYSFRNYGGKDAFFLWMNQHPEEEAKILDQEPDPDSGPSPAPGPAPEPVPDRKPKRKVCHRHRNRVVIAALALLLVGFILGLLAGSFWSSWIQAKQDEEEHTTEPTTAVTETATEHATEPVERAEDIQTPFSVLPDGSVYWGAMENGVPNGVGVQLKGGYYYLGQYDAGKMDGVFAIVSEDGNSRIPFVEFREDEVSWSEGDGLIRCVVSCPVLEIYSEAGGQIIWELEAGAVVYKTSADEIETDGTVWAEVIWNNSVGWIDAAAHSHEVEPTIPTLEGIE